MKLPNLLRLLQSKNKPGQNPTTPGSRRRVAKSSNREMGLRLRDPLKQLHMHLRGATSCHENQNDEPAALLTIPFNEFCRCRPIITRGDYALSC